MNKIKVFSTWLLLTAMCMSITSCGDDDDNGEPVPAPVDNGQAERQKVMKTFTFSYFLEHGSYLVGSFDNTYSCWKIWDSKGADFEVYLMQNKRIYKTGWVHSNDTILTEEERTSKALTFDVEMPTNISRNEPCDMIALTYGVRSTLSDGYIVCNANLKRGRGFHLWDHSGPKGDAETGKSYSLTTIEILSVFNETTDTITVRHRGFDTVEKWYYSEATVSISPDLKAVGHGTSVAIEESSDVYKIAPGSDVSIWSCYVPTGKKMTDASLVLEINGQEVKTSPVSSSADIELGKVYVMKAEWDGNSLKWKGTYDDGDSAQSEISAEAVDLDLPSGTYWASCNVGASKPEEIGDYFAWGETVPKDSYSWSNYVHCDGSEATCHDIGSDIAGTIYDVAHARWGEGWHMPSLEQWQEVINNCTWSKVSLSGISCLKLTSNKNGNSIYLPFTGVKWDSGCYYTESLYCWLSSLKSEGSTFSCYLTFQGFGIGYGRDFERFAGLPVRPVTTEPCIIVHGDNGNNGLHAPQAAIRTF